MPIADDFSVTVDGDIRHDTGTTNYTVLALHRWLQDMADNASVLDDDLVDITSATPSTRSTDNIVDLINSYNIDDDAAKYLYDGSITQAGGNTVYSGLRVLGSVNNELTQLEIVQDNTLIADKFWGTQSGGVGYNGDAAAGILMRCMIKTRTSGADIDGKRARVQARHWGDTYDFFNVTLGVGESVAALGTTPDAQNDTTSVAVAAYTHVTNTEGYQLIDLNNGANLQPYYSQWTFGADDESDQLKSIWEWSKYITGHGAGQTLYGLGGELFLGITHQIDYDNEADGPFIETEGVKWGTGTTAGSGVILALLDEGSSGNLWIQLLTGIAPTDGLELTDGTTTADVDGSPSAKTIPKVFLGSYTGSLIGAYGVGIYKNDLTSSDSVQDLLGITQNPPNNVTFQLTGLTSGEDRVLIGPKAGGNDFDFDQLSLTTTLSAASETQIVVDEAIPTDTPVSGTLRVQLDTLTYRLINFTSWDTSTFQVDDESWVDPNDSTSGNNVMISYVDKVASSGTESFTVIYNAPRSLYIRVRDGGGTPIKTYESEGSLGSAGGSAVASRITDA